MIDKNIFQSKTVWGMIGFTVFGILDLFFPNVAFDTLILISLGWAGYGIRDAL